MKIYLASSWKNESLCRSLALVLRQNGFQVYCFSETHKCNFRWTDLGDTAKYDVRSILTCPQTRNAFDTDLWELRSSNCTVLVLPSGRSAHLEAGYTKGAGRKLFIYAAHGLIEEGFENMYHLADAIFDRLELSNMIAALKEVRV